MYPKTAVILAGGIGERLRPLTNTTPKPLLLIQGKPIMQYAIENLKNHGITNIILAISHHADKIKDYFKDGSGLGVNITYSLEETPLGTGGAVKQASQNIQGPFILAWGDNLMDVNWNEMIQSHQKNQAKLTIALTPREDVENFGAAQLDGEKIIKFVEKPKREEAPSNLINAGAFIVNPEILSILPPGKSSLEYDCFEKLKEGVFAYQHQGQWLPTDNLEKYQTAQNQWKGLKYI